MMETEKIEVTPKKSTAKSVEKNRFADLNSINVGDHTEKKNGLTYLSWAWAWAELKKRYPDSYYIIYEREEEVETTDFNEDLFGRYVNTVKSIPNCHEVINEAIRHGTFTTKTKQKRMVNYHTDGRTCWVKTGIVLVDGNYSKEHIEYLPIMDFKNKSIPYGVVNSMDVNKAIQRSLTKACSRHGIGLYVYAGEDLPEETEEMKAEKAALAAMSAQVIANISNRLAVICKDMDNAAKIEFAKTNITPIIGSANFKACTDYSKLKALEEKLCA